MTNRTDRTKIKNRTDKLTFKLDFPGNLCRAAFAILAMFSQKVLLERMREKDNVPNWKF